ncbi:MFS transporter [Pendulispora albinea]|uniref:Aromatic acid/H+ symport family MFS transporter n=1 Tax=Pendulispora albinea TaxID=2741071 RepID=A0ABZ2LN90_9BACT
MPGIPASEIVRNAPFGPFHHGPLFWCSFIMLSDGYDMVIYGSVVPHVMQQWSLTPAHAGWLGSSALVGMMLGALIVGPLADRAGRRKVILACVALFGASAFANAFAWNAPSFAACRFLTGFGLGATIPNIVALMNELSPAARRNTMITVMLSCYSVGGMISALLALWVIPRFGWPATFVVAGIPLMTLPLMRRGLPESLPFLLLERRYTEARQLLLRIDPIRASGTIDFEEPSSEAAQTVSWRRLFQEGRALSTPMIWLCIAMCMLMVYGLNTWLPKLMMTAGFPLGSSLLFLVVLNVGATVGALVGGWLGDHWGNRRTLVLFFGVAIASLCLLGTRPGPVVLDVLLFVAGATTIGTLAVTHAFAAQLYPDEIRATGMSFCSAMGRMGAIAGPPLGGSLLGLGLSLQQNFVVFAIPGLVAIVAVLLIGSPRRPPHPSAAQALHEVR